MDKPLQTNASPDGLNDQHAFGSGLRHSMLSEQSFSLEANLPKLKSSLDDLSTIGGKGDESLNWTTPMTFLI